MKTGKKILSIVLIEPASSFGQVFGNFPMPRTGLPVLAKIAQDKGFSVRLLVEGISSFTIEEATRMADLAAVSIITPTANRGYETLDLARKYGAITAVGGPHATFMPGEALEHADIVIRGEGEEIWGELLSRFKFKYWEWSDLNEIRGLSYRRVDGEDHHNKDAPLPNLENVPVSSMGLIEGWKKKSLYPIITQRGCPHGCEFCTVRKLNGHKVRCHSSEHIRGQLNNAKRWEAKHLFFVDDNFGANPDHAKKVCRLCLNIAPKIPKGAQVHWSIVGNEELLLLMKKTGFKFLFIGIESFSDVVLSGMNKKVNSEKIKSAIKKLVSMGFLVHGMFVAGGKGDTLENIREIPAVAKDLGLFSIQVMVSTPLPGSDLSDRLLKEGKKPLGGVDWSFYDGHHAVWESENGIRLSEINGEAIKAMERFYSGWSDFLRSILKFGWRGGYIRYVGKKAVKNWWDNYKNSAHLLFLERIDFRKKVF